MAQVNMNGGGNNKRNKPSKRNLRVDFTPMVDMNMLLITFFMFCTTLSMPQVMDIVMPTKDRVENSTQIPEHKAITLILGEDNKVYYYIGKPDYDAAETLQVTNFSKEGLRNVLLGHNSTLVTKANSLKQKRRNGELTESAYKQALIEIKKSDEGAIAVIKPTDKSSYRNLVDALDEMLICNISKYAIVDLEEGDRYLLENNKPEEKITAQNK
ncbi:biopolymer transporter ExbD [Dysgonomonas sp. 216]|uniref:ExbD/TolR family protein n=1 Tax=Dysgonomonas sp. 216 TaxID=2302934 RepID=UPI0013D3664E|nr:biopolymer transporter ExbD [Dysgonomonas sp. 216]NDW19622.1 biopolymer transporter ExbD [Dysgonomonas sp. 216]